MGEVEGEPSLLAEALEEAEAEAEGVMLVLMLGEAEALVEA